MSDTHALFSTERLTGGWRPRRVGRRVRLLAEVTSTNTVALEASAGDDPDGLVVLAEVQTAGRGRLGRTWMSPRGASVLCSVLLIEPEEACPADAEPCAHGNRVAGVLTLAAAVAACEAVRLATEVAPAIKWPNDLRVRGRKLGGILVESRPLAASARAWVVGIGLNCLQHEGHFPSELQGQATSLELESVHAVDRLGVARALLQRLDAWLAPPREQVLASLHAAWNEHAEPVGRHVQVRCGGQDYAGTTVAVDPAGGLILQLDGGGQAWFDPLLTTLL